MDKLKQDQLMQHTNTRKNYLALTLLGLAVCVIGILFFVFIPEIDGRLRFPERLAAFPTIQVAYNNISNKISDSTKADKLLRVEYDKPLHLLRDTYLGCIRGGYSHIYGSYRTKQEILDSFIQYFSNLEWKEREDVIFYSAKEADIAIRMLDPSSLDNDLKNNNFGIIYRVLLSYGDPEILTCMG
jgi:hypothetical protein